MSLKIATALSLGLSTGPAVADPVAGEDLQTQISSQILAIEVALHQIQTLAEKKPLSARGWTALDDMIVGSAEAATSGAIFGLLYLLPKYAPSLFVGRSAALSISRTGTAAFAGVGVLNFLQGLTVSAFVPRGELNATDSSSPTASAPALDALDLSTLSESQAVDLLRRLDATRRDLERSAERVSKRLAPKFESRLAFIASDVLNGGFALLAIGGGLFVVASQMGRIGQVLRVNSAAAKFIREHQEILEQTGTNFGFAFLVQGVATTLSGLVIKAFVPRGTEAAPPVN